MAKTRIDELTQALNKLQKEVAGLRTVTKVQDKALAKLQQAVANIELVKVAIEPDEPHGPPWSQNQETHEKIMERIRAMSPAEALQNAVRAGIYTPDGKLSPEYLANPSPTETPMGRRKAPKTVRFGNLEWEMGFSEPMTWEEAKQYATKKGGGWRLPTRKELLTLVDDTEYQPASSVPLNWPAENLWFWSSSAYISDTSYAWVVFFYNGYTSYNNVTNTYRVRCVRNVKTND